MSSNISILLINPWIIDFAAYNFWAEPLGLLYIGSILKDAGCYINYVDCLTSIYEKNPKSKDNGCSKYLRKRIKKPDVLSSIPRHYALYGIHEDEFIQRLALIPIPDAILVTSIMTYWYPGVFKAIKLVKEFYKHKAPIILGGIYPKLCYKHAQNNSGADFIFIDENISHLFKLIERITDKRFKHIPTLNTFSDYPAPLHELGRERDFFSILTGRGCPYACSYCASGILNKGFSRRSKESVIKEIQLYSKMLKTKNIAFYDDALLVNAEEHIIPILEEIIKDNLQVSIHLPNGINSRFITKRIAQLFNNSGVETIRLGFETADENLQSKTGGKTTNELYLKAVEHLLKAGYTSKSIGTYIMVGLPSQTAFDVENSINFVYRAGASPFLSYFSPIPGTKIWKETVLTTSFPIEQEPLFQNNTFFLLGNKNFPAQTVKYLKSKALEMRKPH